MIYEPDNWVVVKLCGPTPHYRVLVGWSGGYTTGDSWRMNSGITKMVDTGDHYIIHGTSASQYKCHKQSYCLRMNNAYIWRQLQELHGDKVTMMDENTDWSTVDWLIQKEN